MKTMIAVVALTACMGALGSQAMADEILVRFEAATGAVPVAGTTGAANENGAFSGTNRYERRGQPGSIAGLPANMKANGTVKGEGLLLAGGDMWGGHRGGRGGGGGTNANELV